LFHLAKIYRPFPCLLGIHEKWPSVNRSKSHDRLQNLTLKEVSNFLCSGLQGRKRDFVFIGELHVGLACDIRVIPSLKQIAPEEDLV
jgi:hypothetical protein